jgi:hypothetical protein
MLVGFDSTMYGRAFSVDTLQLGEISLMGRTAGVRINDLPLHVLNENELTLLIYIAGPENEPTRLTEKENVIETIHYNTLDTLADVTFVCNDGVKVKACKALLATISDVFNRMFCNDGNFKPVDEILLDDYDSGTVKKLVQMSIDRSYNPHANDYAFVVLCNEYLIHSVVDKWCEFMVRSIDHTSAVNTLSIARILGSKLLATTAKRCIKNNSAQIKNLDLLEKEDLIEILTTI